MSGDRIIERRSDATVTILKVRNEQLEMERDKLQAALSDLLGAVIAGVADRRHIDRARKALAKEGE